MYIDGDAKFKIKVIKINELDIKWIEKKLFFKIKTSLTITKNRKQHHLNLSNI